MVSSSEKPIFIINGSAGVGKDTFVKMTNIYTDVLNYSAVDKIKQIARMIGWDGQKDEKSRKLLSDLKFLTTEYNDMSFRDVQMMVDFFRINKNYKIMFIHIREPCEIDRAKIKFNAKTLLILRESVENINTNNSDANVFDYNYDFIIENNGSVNDLKKAANKFLTTQGVL